MSLRKKLMPVPLTLQISENKLLLRKMPLQLQRVRMMKTLLRPYPRLLWLN